ncbi:MAG: glutamate-5-semialdehyde dehydrogenase [Cytophagales bacterium]|nr:glutamate-5-semialdehyde dehydrogenase [Bernardetiaceae bacterium]MDW8205120.1 glutamate-5-semialdehyde dehydrogenase [Cytophagales bacterium]
MNTLVSLIDRSVMASRMLAQIPQQTVARALQMLADAIVEAAPTILAANAADLARMLPNDPKYDRLLLSTERINNIAQEIRHVAQLPSPLGEILEERRLSNGLHLQKVRVPLGVVGIIYEARPNVTLDVSALCLRSGNAALLKGGSDASATNEALSAIIRQTLVAANLPADAIILLPAAREATEVLLQAVGKVDVIIPRGSKQLIDFVRQHARVPVIETGAGIVHTYVDSSADTAKAANIIFNAKTRRVSVCNALDCLIVHRDKLAELADITCGLAAKQVQIFADEQAYAALKHHYPEHLLKKAAPEHFGVEFLDYKMSIKTVANIEEALLHIAAYSSKHSEAIIAEDSAAIERFLDEVDAAAVYANASTAFTDGAQFGMGAEIGISTQKLHARGPMALPELTSYKWKIRGNGQTRP